MLTEAIFKRLPYQIQMDCAHEACRYSPNSAVQRFYGVYRENGFHV